MRRRVFWKVNIRDAQPPRRENIMKTSNGEVRPAVKETELYYLHVPARFRPVQHKIDFLPVTQFLEDEESCAALWGMLDGSFKTRSKFLAVWPSVRFVAAHGRGTDLAGFLLVSTPINWQIDYVVVRPQRRHEGIAASLVNETVNQALARKVPYLMLTSREGLRELYEGTCGFSVVGGSKPEPAPVPEPPVFGMQVVPTCRT
jgi:ribosomal protein S18 acetylase RimI-like enzyme